MFLHSLFATNFPLRNEIWSKVNSLLFRPCSSLVPLKVSLFSFCSRKLINLRVSCSSKQAYILESVWAGLNTTLVFSIQNRNNYSNKIGMNPENRGEHIVLRHSLLWKNPLVYEKPVKQSKICHLQLNQLGADGQLWRTRNSNFNSTFTFKKKTHPSKIKKTLDASAEGKQMSISSYVTDSAVKAKGMKLVDGMQKMRQEKTIQASCVTLAPYPGVGRMPFVINDYHPKVANPNYSRNSKGKHFTS